MSTHFAFNPKLDFAIERFIDAPPLVWTSMLFPGYRPAVFDDIPITAIVTMESVGTGTRYVFTALHRSEADLETNKTSGFYQGDRDRRRSVRGARARDEVVPGGGRARPATDS
ncbi:MAG: hypothetical protein IPN47_23225 [Gemmatimonadetes bacterium]|nr:hypothetical protein [Gemmatimonadota bacterium]